VFEGKPRLRARALLIGEHLDLRALDSADSLADNPLVINAGASGAAVLFRYGAVVLFNLSPVEEVSFLKHLEPMLRESFEPPEIEEGDLEVLDSGAERVEKGVIKLRDLSVERLQVVADVLAKSAVLSYYEGSISTTFESIGPFAQSLRGSKAYGFRGRQRDSELLSTIGNILLIQHKTVGLVEVGEKPEVLWERPDLERLYARLEDEYELRERQRALERKLDVISRTAETVLNLLQHKTGLRVEWYIVVLIVVEIGLIIFQMLFGIH
jgi:uncharacterized Rmd1/YagE family protein